MRLSPTILFFLITLSACSIGSKQQTSSSTSMPSSSATSLTSTSSSDFSSTSASSQSSAASSYSSTSSSTPVEPDCTEITFTLQNEQAERVWVSGDWLEWANHPDQGALEMTESTEQEGLWNLTTSLPAGVQRYQFIVDGEHWQSDPENPHQVPDGFGNTQSLMDVCASACTNLDSGDWRDSMVYHILIDRFRNGDGQVHLTPGLADNDPSSGPSAQIAGGDLSGVNQGLAYIRSLGFNTLLLSPPYQNRTIAGANSDLTAGDAQVAAYRGHWPSPAAIDYSDMSLPQPLPQVDSRWGSAADLQQLITSAQGTSAETGVGMKVLLEYVANHVDIESGLYAAQPNWFARDDQGNFRLCGPENLWDDPYWSTRCAFADYLAPFDFDQSEVRRWLGADAQWWAQTYQVDGFLLSNTRHLSAAMVGEIKDLLALNTDDSPAPVLLGEHYSTNPSDLQDMRQIYSGIDGWMDTPLRQTLCESLFFSEGNLQSLEAAFDSNTATSGHRANALSFVGSADWPRAIHFASGDISLCGTYPSSATTFNQPNQAQAYQRLALAYAVLFTNPGTPTLLYGDEIGLAGGAIPDNHRTLPWSDEGLNSHQINLRQQVQTLTQLRSEYPALRRGFRQTLALDDSTWLYQMNLTQCSEESVLVAINRSDTERSITMPSGDYTNLLTQNPVAGGPVNLAARSYLVLRKHLDLGQ